MKQIVLILSLMMLLVACGSDEPTTEKEQDVSNISLVGTWMLDQQEATLTFYNNGVLKYQNRHPKDHPPESGTYNYTYSDGILTAKGFSGPAIISRRADGVYILTISGFNNQGATMYEGYNGVPCINGTWVKQ